MPRAPEQLVVLFDIAVEPEAPRERPEHVAEPVVVLPGRRAQLERVRHKVARVAARHVAQRAVVLVRDRIQQHVARAAAVLPRRLHLAFRAHNVAHGVERDPLAPGTRVDLDPEHGRERARRSRVGRRRARAAPGLAVERRARLCLAQPDRQTRSARHRRRRRRRRAARERAAAAAVYTVAVADRDVARAFPVGCLRFRFRSLLFLLVALVVVVVVVVVVAAAARDV